MTSPGYGSDKKRRAKAREKTFTNEMPEHDSSLDFRDLFGFDAWQDLFCKLKQEERLPQCLLLEGRPGIGKKKLLRKLAASLYCETGVGCGHCAACLDVIEDREQDLLWLASETQLKVSDADAFQEHLNYQAQTRQAKPRPRVVALVDLETLSTQAANRLLKVLEEPPSGCYILVSCSHPQQLLATLLSRLVRWTIAPPNVQLSLAFLAEKTDRSPAELRLYLERYGLSPGRALTALQRAQGEGREDLRALSQLLMKPFSPESLPLLQDTLKQLAFKAPDLAQHMELSLNYGLKQRLGQLSDASEALSLSPDFFRHKRQVLRRIYRAGGQSRNHLNVSLAAEALIMGREEEWKSR